MGEALRLTPVTVTWVLLLPCVTVNSDGAGRVAPSGSSKLKLRLAPVARVVISIGAPCVDVSAASVVAEAVVALS